MVSIESFREVNSDSIVGTVLSGLNREVDSLGRSIVSIVGTVLSGLNMKCSLLLHVGTHNRSHQEFIRKSTQLQ